MQAIDKIVIRARLLMPTIDRLSLFMDLEYIHNTIGLELNDLLNTDNSNFIHDIVGITNNINRLTGRLENCFVPRYSKNYPKEEKTGY